MIRIARGEEPEALREARWWRLARARHERVTGRLRDGVFDGYDDARATLYARQIGRCAFCENRAFLKGEPVEHFRPKQTASRIDWSGLLEGASDEDRRRFARGLPPVLRESLAFVRWEEEEGYWWLTWTWTNLFFGCTSCNSGYKHARFPLERDSPAARGMDDAVEDERPLLLDPASDWPMDHIRFRRVFGKWTPEPRDGSRRGAWTIALLGMAEVDHLDHYTSHASLFEPAIDALKAQVKQTLADPARCGRDEVEVVWSKLRGLAFEDGQPFRALLWDVLDQAVPEDERAALGLGHPRPDEGREGREATREHNPAGMERVTDADLRWALRRVWPKSTEAASFQAALVQLCAAMPSTASEIASLLGRTEDTLDKHLEELVRQRRLRLDPADGSYCCEGPT